MIYKRDLDAEGRRVFEYIAGPDTEKPNIGPASVSLYNLKVAEAMQMLNQEVRYNSVIGRRNTEIAILVAAREFDQQYEWSMHEDTARNEGVPGAVIDAIKYHRELDGLEADAALVISYGREIFREHRLSSRTFAAAVSRFGKRGAFEIAAIMGDYTMAAIMLHAIDQQLAEDREPLLPINK
jgi:4-carboxymuconolactone decarboxylase